MLGSIIVAVIALFLYEKLGEEPQKMIGFFVVMVNLLAGAVGTWMRADIVGFILLPIFFSYFLFLDWHHKILQRIIFPLMKFP